MKKKLFSLTVLLSAATFTVVFVQAQVRQNNDWFQRQQQQQRIMEQQRQQQIREQQRQQIREQQRQQMRQEVQQQMRRQMQEQQRLQMQQQMRGGIRSGLGNVTPFRGPINYRPGLTGRTTADGRAIVVMNNRVFVVPKARVANIASNDNIRRAQTVRWTDSQRAAVTTEIRRLATLNARERARLGEPGHWTREFNRAAGGGNGGGNGGGAAAGGRRGGGRRGGGGDDRSGGNGPSQFKKGDLTRTFKEAAGAKKKSPKKLKHEFNRPAGNSKTPAPPPTPTPPPTSTPPSRRPAPEGPTP